MEGGKFTQRVGSRRQVMSGTARQTSGGLRKKDLMLNKRGRIVSRRKSAAAKRSKIVNRVSGQAFNRQTARAALALRGRRMSGGALEGGEALEVPLEAGQVPLEAGAQCGMRRY